MGTWYDIYTIADIKGKKRCLDCYVMDIKKNELHLYPTYSNGSRSYFGEAFEKLEEIGRFIFVNEIPEEILKIYTHITEDEQYYYKPFVVNLSTLSSNIPDRYEHTVIAHKDDIFKYEYDGMEWIEGISPAEYSQLDETAKKLYEIYQYDDDMGWLKYFKILREKANGVINRFCDENYIFDDIDAQLLVIAG